MGWEESEGESAVKSVPGRTAFEPVQSNNKNKIIRGKHPHTDDM